MYAVYLIQRGYKIIKSWKTTHEKSVTENKKHKLIIINWIHYGEVAIEVYRQKQFHYEQKAELIQRKLFIPSVLQILQLHHQQEQLSESVKQFL